MKLSNRERFSISEAAAQWLVRLERDDSAENQAGFAEWCRQSPLHVEEFLFAKATWQHLYPIDPKRSIDLEQLDSGSVLPLPESSRASLPREPSQRPAFPMRSRWLGGIAASLAVFAILWALLSFVPSASSHLYSTAAGDQLSIKLEDGSVLHLNTLSRAEVNYTKNVREVKLLEGEGLFVVERESTRPFRVVTDSATIQAIGTQFNVYKRLDKTRVSVLEGTVRVAPAPTQRREAPELTARAKALLLSAGEEVNVAEGQAIKQASPNVQRVVAWRSRRLVFQADPLQTVVDEFNRYEKDQPIRLEGKEIQQRAISGVFDADDPRPLIDFLKQDPGLSVSETDAEILIRSQS